MLETVSDKHLHEMERLTKELLRVMYKAKLRDLPLIELLHELNPWQRRYDGSASMLSILGIAATEFNSLID